MHLGGFVLDLTVGFWLLWPKSRPLATVFTASFHLMNLQLFTIGTFLLPCVYVVIFGHKLPPPLGMFPYVCLATLPVFFDDDWPKRWIARCSRLLIKCLPNTEETKKITTTTAATTTAKRGTETHAKSSRFKVVLMGLYVATQLTLPWSHSVTQVFRNYSFVFVRSSGVGFSVFFNKSRDSRPFLSDTFLNVTRDTITGPTDCTAIHGT